MSTSIDRLAQALDLLDTARASPDGVSTGATRDAREWLEEAARAVVAEQRKSDANAEHDAKIAIKRAGLIPWAHLGTQEPHA